MPEGTFTDHPEGGVKVVVLKLKEPPVGALGAVDDLWNTCTNATEFPSSPDAPTSVVTEPLALAPPSLPV